jgi:hypothetical protein
MPWFGRSAGSHTTDTISPPASAAERDVCKDAACLIQACLKKNNYQMSECGAAVAALRACCQAGKARASVHCTAAWVQGADK